ncbi:hypothetical protein J3459_007434 [Metarhizium acridum]|nr:hypothetical protein J3459_007434 [Metarhizium acridum]
MKFLARARKTNKFPSSDLRMDTSRGLIDMGENVNPPFTTSNPNNNEDQLEQWGNGVRVSEYPLSRFVSTPPSPHSSQAPFQLFAQE